MSPWKRLEVKVRDLASVIWGRNAVAERISGVNFDAVLRISDEEVVLIEVTEEFNLGKIRSDIAKIQAVKHNFISSGILAKSFIVLDQEPTPGMAELGRDSKVMVISVESLVKMAFDFKSYVSVRSARVFGSAINPGTGEPDRHKYIPVFYSDDSDRKDFSVAEVAAKLSRGEKLVLLGDYGTGKSRCTKEVFSLLVNDSATMGKFVFL